VTILAASVALRHRVRAIPTIDQRKHPLPEMAIGATR